MVIRWPLRPVSLLFVFHHCPMPYVGIYMYFCTNRTSTSCLMTTLFSLSLNFQTNFSPGYLSNYSAQMLEMLTFGMPYVFVLIGHQLPVKCWYIPLNFLWVTIFILLTCTFFKQVMSLFSFKLYHPTIYTEHTIHWTLHLCNFLSFSTFSLFVYLLSRA